MPPGQSDRCYYQQDEGWVCIVGFSSHSCWTLVLCGLRQLLHPQCVILLLPVLGWTPHLPHWQNAIQCNFAVQCGEGTLLLLLLLLQRKGHHHNEELYNKVAMRTKRKARAARNPKEREIKTAVATKQMWITGTKKENKTIITLPRGHPPHGFLLQQTTTTTTTSAI